MADSNRLQFPALASIEPATINAWLNRCEDAFELWSLTGTTLRTMDESLRVLLAGTRMEEPVAAQWWNENRETLKALKAWTAFVSAVKERFIPASWKMDGLLAFYLISQGSLPFLDFVTRLQAARTAIASAGKGIAISDTIMKNHLLFHANRLLTLRVCALQSLDLPNIKVDGLISLMSGTWNSMVAEGVSRPVGSRTVPVATAPQVVPAVPSQVPARPMDRESLRAAGGCFNCHKIPSSLGWTPHTSRNCPGDAARGIAPRYIVAALAPGDTEYDNEEHHATVAAILPSSMHSFVLEGDSDEEESDY